jgi:hypothetical protein
MGIFWSEFPTAEMDVHQCCLEIPMTSEDGEVLQQPAGAGQVSQTEMAQRVGCEPVPQANALSYPVDHIDPRPYRERLPTIPPGH